MSNLPNVDKTSVTVCAWKPTEAANVPVCCARGRFWVAPTQKRASPLLAGNGLVTGCDGCAQLSDILHMLFAYSHGAPVACVFSC